jgi:hypothetical protein
MSWPRTGKLYRMHPRYSLHQDDLIPAITFH